MARSYATWTDLRTLDLRPSIMRSLSAVSSTPRASTSLGGTGMGTPLCSMPPSGISGSMIWNQHSQEGPSDIRLPMPAKQQQMVTRFPMRKLVLRFELRNVPDAERKEDTDGTQRNETRLTK
ncbi:hypothetical protein EYF80_056989 [Liparis tanakae]|uniref:Uncharacterized protein n=1 Tax=Liparis tanakae TaxID=230148 RepID=A0A4Z2EVI0_9TELE|nr:hypothetical protein EYF80_056989 [Liparis tanakae]